jgi:hypothetical protein
MRSNFEINKWFCLLYGIAFCGFVIVGCAEERLREPIKVVLTEVEPVRPSRSAPQQVSPEPARPEPSIRETKKPATIIMYESESCVWCTFWWSSHRLNWEKAGWRVERKHYSEFQGENAPTGVPFFEVWDTEKTFIVKQFLDLQAYKAFGGK